jgi:hypothetical protein
LGSFSDNRVNQILIRSLPNCEPRRNGDKPRSRV